MRALLIVALLGSQVLAAPKKHDPGALVLVMDRSGSMQGPKLEAAKDTMLAVVDQLEPNDELAIIVFDSEPSVLVPRQKVGDKKAIIEAIRKLDAGGGTAIVPALQVAEAELHGSKLAHKHLILLSDGEAPSDGLDEVLEKLVKIDHATMSAVGVQGADRNLLMRVPDAGDGRLFMVDDLGSLPKIFLKEIKSAFKR